MSLRLRLATLAMGVALGAIPRAALAELTPAEVVRSVDAHHPRLARESARIEASEGELQAARGAFDPRAALRGSVYPTGYYQSERFDLALEAPTPLYGAAFSLGYRLTRGDVPVYDGRLETLDRGELRFGLRMPLLQDLRIDAPRAGRARAELDVTVAMRTMDTTRLELLRAAMAAYYRWVLAGRARAVATDLADLAVRRNEQLTRLSAAGSIPPIEARENERAMLQRQARLVTAEVRERQAAVTLGLYVRGEDGEPTPPTRADQPTAVDASTEPPEPLSIWLERALERRPELATLRVQLERADVAVELARTGRLPRLDLSASVSRDFGNGAGDAQYRLGQTVVEAGLTLSSPVPNRTGTGRFDARSADLEALDAEVAFTVDQVRAQVADAHMGLEASIAALALEARSAALAAELARAEYRRFEEGATTLLLVNLREQLAAEAALALAEREVEVALARAMLTLVVGDTPTGAAARPSRPSGTAIQPR